MKSYKKNQPKYKCFLSSIQTIILLIKVINIEIIADIFCLLYYCLFYVCLIWENVCRCKKHRLIMSQVNRKLNNVICFWLKKFWLLKWIQKNIKQYVISPIGELIEKSKKVVSIQKIYQPIWYVKFFNAKRI